MRLEAGLWLAWAVPALLVVLGVGWIQAHPYKEFWDQETYVQSRFRDPGSSVLHYPRMEDGVVSKLFAEVVNAVIRPSERARNPLFMSLALVFYVGAFLWLASLVLESAWSVAAFTLLLFSTKMPFIWLSTELMTGGLLALGACAVLRPGTHPVLSGALIACAGLGKGEMLLPGGALLWVAWRNEREAKRRRLLLASFAGVFGVLAGTSFLAHGRGSFGGRALCAFLQHYAELVSNKQLVRPVPHPFFEYQKYGDAFFPGMTSVSQIMIWHTYQYIEFVALAIIRGIKNFWAAIGPLSLLLGFRLWLELRRGESWSRHERLLGLVGLATVLPWVLVSFPHIRYFARFVPWLCLAGLRGVERASATGSARQRYVAWGLAASAFAWGLANFLADPAFRGGLPFYVSD